MRASEIFPAFTRVRVSWVIVENPQRSPRAEGIFFMAPLDPFEERGIFISKLLIGLVRTLCLKKYQTPETSERITSAITV